MPSKDQIIKAPEIIELSGSPREAQIGLKHGRILATKIHSQIKVYEAMFQQTSKLSWADVRSIARDYSATIQKLTPDLGSEMAFIAEGANVDLLDITALNCRSEIALGLFSDGCTSMGWKREGGEVLLAQNWDWTRRVKESLVMMSIEKTGKPKIWMVTEAGIVGKIGFNSSSVGTTLNAIRARPTDASKVPIHVALRLCLEAETTAAAISKLESLGGLASSAHILLADPTGPISLELSPKGDKHIASNEKGIVCHTNHFLQNRFVDEPPWLSGSPIRLTRIQQLTDELATSGENVDAEVLRTRIFSDGFNAPQAICCEEDPKRAIETRSSTLFNIVMRFVDGEEPSAEVVWGRPGSGEEGRPLKMPW
ncbi:acyl-coenzyme A:6-aminopenicillanic acid acyl-transferase-domain-containing protein [Cadophora sp. MPI-SDFR-AT-0126]|nr:acyl-coenzyme A:6-aminopenicillanic acid acyl-transferase-domain-containing protein [Leotiomycetes sp. MPI-SDFR-AT-0126]